MLLPVLSFAFARAPLAECVTSPSCVLVKNTHCGDLQAITIGQDAAWAKWEKRLSEAARDQNQSCKPGSKMDPRMFEAFCDDGKCAVRAKTMSDAKPEPSLKP
ncbi:MAG: hypothetical protein EOP11_00090 [Proteobacteria bacterium]|nr:MAG: hypothetical protein EOP11_00090 [Pseudomonadota bacterium]